LDLTGRLLAGLKKPTCPDGMLRIFQEVTRVFHHVIMMTGKGEDITADVQIPLMLLVLLKSDIKNLLTVTHFIEKFCH
jgi:hypothetical protein